MPGITQYLFETTFCLAVFYGFYYYFLRKKFLTRWNRWYLLTTPVLSLIIPGLDIVSFFQELLYASNLDTKLLSQTEDFNLAIAEKLEENTPLFQLRINDLFKGIYLMGVTLLGFRFIDKYWKWVMLFQKKKPNWYVGYTLDNPYVKFPNDSLFSFLFWNKKLLPESLKNQLRTRKIQLNWTHSLDVILMNVILIGMWFHPLIYLYKKELHTWHEHNLIAKLNFESKTFTPFRHIVLTSICLVSVLALFSSNVIEQSPLNQSIGAVLTKIENQSGYIIYEHQKTKPAIYRMEWGQLNLHLESVAAPNGYSGETELELSEFSRILDSSLVVYKDSVDQVFQTLDIEVKRAENRRTLWFPNQNPDSINLAYRWQKNKIIELAKGDELSLTGKVGDIYLAGVKIKIKDPFELYTPNFSAPPIDRTEAHFRFQVVNLPNRKSIIRIDTLNDKTKHILELYRDPDKYKINHIPNFRTNKRLVGSENVLYPNIDDENLIEKPAFDIYDLPEFHFGKKNLIRLFWGKMIAAPNSKNYTNEQFKNYFRSPIQLKISKDYLEIVHFRLVTVSKNELPKSFLLTPEKMQHISYDLKKLSAESSIYFEDIVIKFNDQLMQFPISFLFNIGKDKNEYELAIAESKPETVKDARRQEGYLFYQNYSLSEIIRVLTGDERLVFDSNIEEPKLDILFQSPHLPNSKGENLILEKLQEQFHYQTDLKFDTRTIWVIQPPDFQSLLEPFEYFYNVRPNLEQIIKENEAKGYETITPGFFDDLARLIEDQFGIYVFNESNIHKAYGLGLDLSSFKALRKQLKKDYGIVLTREKRTIRTRKIRN
jgi:hypothetical protein